MTDDEIASVLFRLEEPWDHPFVTKAEAAAAIRFLLSERDDAIATGNAAAAAAVSQLHVVARERDEARAEMTNHRSRSEGVWL